MLTRANERIETPGYDNLIYDLNPPAEVFAVQIAAGQGELKRGSVLSRESDGTMTLMASGGTANCILALDANATEAVDSMAYRAGHFAENELIVAQGYALTEADKEALRDVGILISDAMEY